MVFRRSALPSVSYAIDHPCVFTIQGAYLLCSVAIRRDTPAVWCFCSCKLPCYTVALSVVALRVLLYHFLCAALYSCSCELRWRSSRCVLLPSFNELLDIFAVMNCSVVTLSVGVFCSGLATCSHGCRKGGFWNFLQKKFIFLVLSGKKQSSPLSAPAEKYLEKSPSGPP